MYILPNNTNEHEPDIPVFSSNVKSFSSDSNIPKIFFDNVPNIEQMLKCRFDTRYSVEYTLAAFADD